MGFCECLLREVSRASGPSRLPLSPSPAIQPSYQRQITCVAFTVSIHPASLHTSPPRSAQRFPIIKALSSPPVVQQQFPLRYESTTNDSYCKHTITVHLGPCDFTGNSNVFSQKNFDETTVRRRCIHRSPRITQNPNSIAPTT